MAVKLLCVGVLVVCGVLFLRLGFEGELPLLDWKGHMIRDVPAGLILLAGAVALAICWNIIDISPEGFITFMPVTP